jgi:putative inorganic carbon (HCO3(-)) transporter
VRVFDYGFVANWVFYRMNTDLDYIQDLKLKSFIVGMRAESVAFWLLCFYILLEYLRPQNMYPVLDFIPWGQVAILGCFASVFATNNKMGSYGAMDKMFVALTALVILSVLFAYDSSVSMKYWSTYTSWILMYFCMVAIVTTPNRLLLLVIFFVLINFKLSQHGARTFAMRGFSFAKYGLSGSPGWFHNSGELALQMVVMFSMSLSLLIHMKKYFTEKYRWWLLLGLFPGSAALTAIGSSSRGGQLALVVVVLLLAVKAKNFFRNLIALSLVVLIGLYFLPNSQKERFLTSELRLLHWAHAIETLNDNPLGIGYKNWTTYYSQNFNVEFVEQVHNTSLQAFTELGWQGGILFHVGIGMALVMNRRSRKEMAELEGVKYDAIASVAQGVNLGLIGTFVASFFMSVLWYPMYWLAFSMSSVIRKIAIEAYNKENLK